MSVIELHLLAITSVVLGLVSAGWLAVDVVRHPPHMAVMKWVWPLCGLFGSVLVLAFYLRHGREPAHAVSHMHDAGDGQHAHHQHDPSSDAAVSWASVAKGTLHCGSGCTLGDLIAETLLHTFPMLAVAFGWHWLFDDRMFAGWVLDSILALAVGIVFQYFAIAPMRGLGVREGLKAAAKADIASLAAWQVGMFAVMAVFQLVLFPDWLGRRSNAAMFEFWWAMQWAMLGGFVTAFPVNAWLIRKGIKEAM